VIEDFKALYRTRQTLDEHDVLAVARKRLATASINQAKTWDLQARNEATRDLNPVARPTAAMPVRISKPTAAERVKPWKQRKSDTFTRLQHDREYARAVAEGPGVDNVQPVEVAEAKLYEALVVITQAIEVLTP